MTTSDTHPAEAPRRYVGSLTLGACLIAAGIFFLCYWFLPDFNWRLTLKIAPPVALCLLGVEVLWFANHTASAKRSLVSVFMCLLLMACCFGLTLMPALGDEIDAASAAYDAFTNSAPEVRIYSLDSSPHFDDVSLYVSLQGPFDDAEAFADDCYELTQIARGLDMKLAELSFTSRPLDTEDFGSVYVLELSDPAQLDWTADEMAQAVEDNIRLNEYLESGDADSGELIEENEDAD